MVLRVIIFLIIAGPTFSVTVVSLIVSETLVVLADLADWIAPVIIDVRVDIVLTAYVIWGDLVFVFVVFAVIFLVLIVIINSVTFFMVFTKIGVILQVGFNIFFRPVFVVLLTTVGITSLTTGADQTE
jgi:hypothetical protein